MKKQKLLTVIIIAILVAVVSAALVGCSKDITITYDLGYDNIKSTEAQNRSEEFSLFSPQRDGYVFCYWKNDKGEKQDNLASYKEDTTLYAVWGYEITYFYKGKEIQKGALEVGKTLENGSDFEVKDDSLTVTGYYTTDGEGNILNDVTKAQITAKTKVNVSLMTKGLVIEKVREKNGGDYALTVTNYTGTSEKVIIPTIYDGEKVTAIGNRLRNVGNGTEVTGAFEAVEDKKTGEYLPKVTSIDIPDTITAIQSMAFKNALYLEKIYFPKNIETFGVGVMTNTSGKTTALKEIEFAADCKLKDTNFEAFGEHKNLRKVILPDGLEVLGDSAFRGCTALRSIDLKNVKTLRRGVFWECSAFKTLKIPNTLKVIETTYNSGDADGDVRPDNSNRIKLSLFNGIKPDTSLQIYVEHNGTSGVNFEEGWDRCSYGEQNNQVPVYFRPVTVKYETRVFIGEGDNITEKVLTMSLEDVHLFVTGYYSPMLNTPVFETGKDLDDYLGLKVKGDTTNNIIITQSGGYDITNYPLVSNANTVFEIVYK